METSVLRRSSPRRMKKVVVNVEERGYSFFMKLLENFTFVQVENDLPKQLSKEDQAIVASLKRAVKDVKLYKQGKLKTVPLEDFLNEL